MTAGFGYPVPAPQGQAGIFNLTFTPTLSGQTLKGLAIVGIADGTSNTVALCESTRDVYNGRCTPWAYRGWVQVGNDIGSASGINNWIYPTAGQASYKVGRVGSWAWPGSLHPRVCGVTMGDGAVLAADSFLMKGETIQPRTRWGGNPAREM